MFKEEEYLSKIVSRKARSLISQIRLGILPLEIEVGRFRGVSPEDRLCQNCNMGVVESEVHFICECPLYNDLRHAMNNKYIFPVNATMTDMTLLYLTLLIYLVQANTVQRVRDVRPVFGPMWGQRSGRWASIGPALG